MCRAGPNPGSESSPRSLRFPAEVRAFGGKMGTKLYVGNLPFSITSQELSDLFSQAGEVVSANIITDRFSGQSRGFGFVEMANEDSAHNAAGQFSDYQRRGRGLKVNEAKPREGGRGGGGGGGGGGGDRGSGRRW